MLFQHFQHDPQWHKVQIARIKRQIQRAQLRYDRTVSDSKEADIINNEAKAQLRQARQAHRATPDRSSALDVEIAEEHVRKAVANAEAWEAAIGVLWFEVEKLKAEMRKAQAGYTRCLRRQARGGVSSSEDDDDEEEEEEEEEGFREQEWAKKERKFDEEERKRKARERQRGQRREDAKAYAFPSSAAGQGKYITPAAIAAFHLRAKEALADYASISIFPHVPSEPCGNVSCAATAPTRALKACKCNIVSVFGGVAVADLKKVRRAWHPDRFSAAKPEVREDFRKKAGEIFVVLSEMMR